MYKINIIKVEETIRKERVWNVIKEGPITEDELDESSNYLEKDRIRKKIESGEVVIVKKYGYLPEDKEIPQERETKIYEQTIDKLDMNAVIKAINSLP